MLDEKENPAGAEAAGFEAKRDEDHLIVSKSQQTLALNLAALFANPDVTSHYTWRPGPLPLAGEKRKGEYANVPGDPTLAEWEAHIRGEVGLLTVPVRKDGTTIWGLIDVDVYDTDYNQIIDRLIPHFIVTRSKSGGYHIWLFFSKPVKAAWLRKQLPIISKSLGFPKDRVEFFPKQDKLGGEGSGVNMPFFGNERLGFGGYGLDHFLTRRKRSPWTKAHFTKVIEGISGDDGEDDVDPGIAYAQRKLKELTDELAGAGFSRNAKLTSVTFYLATMIPAAGSPRKR